MLCYVWREEDLRRRIILAPLDLLQVDLLASERALFGREAAYRERRSRERSSRATWNPTKDFFESL